MATRILSAAILVCAAAGEVLGQAAGPGLQAVPAGAWGSSPRAAARVTAGSGTLPNEQGQVWREYDISPYTTRVTTTKRPEQAVVDWILHETGYEVWHGEPLGILSATPRTLRVYHTPQVQAVVADVVQRFVAAETQSPAVSFRIVTVDNPNWRARAQRALRSVPLQTPGANAWLMPKEEAALLLADFQRRNDYREHSSAYLLAASGESTIVSQMRARAYVRDAIPRPGAGSPFTYEPGQVVEGFSLELSPLVSADGRTVDAMVKCTVDQLERLVPVVLDLPVTYGSKQRAKIDVPQMTHFCFQERLRWPVGQVLLVSLGMVALPVPLDGKPPAAGMALPLLSTPPRADLLLFLQSGR